MIEERKGAVWVRLRVQPKSSRDAICIEPDGRIRVAVTAPPADGAANKALIALIAGRMEIPRKAVTLVRGERSREKTLSLAGISAAAVRKKLGTC